MIKTRKDPKGRVLKKGETVRKDGSYQFSYYDTYGVRKYIYAPDLLTLREKEEELLRDRLDGIDSIAAKRLSLNECFARYMKTRVDLEKRTYGQYLYQYDKYVRHTIGKRTLKDIRYTDVFRLYSDMICFHKVSYSTVEHVHRIIYPVYEAAVRDNIVRNNPTTHALQQVRKQFGAVYGKRKALTPEEQEAFLDFMKDHPVYGHWYPIYLFFLGTGVRMGEFAALTWKDIDFDKKVITINKSLVYIGGKYGKIGEKLFISTPKTDAGIRKIPMASEVEKALRDVKAYQKSEDIKCNIIIDGITDFVFLNRFGSVFLEANINKTLQRIIKAHNETNIYKSYRTNQEPFLLPHFSPHSLRHTFCTRLCENESNIKVIQSIMGHVDVNTTMNIYAEVSEIKKNESFRSLEDKLGLK